MSDYATIVLDTQSAPVARLTLNRPDKRNPIGPQSCGELVHALGRIKEDPALRAVVLTGAGKFFSAEITVYRVAYLRQNHGYEVVSYGRLGKVDYQADKSGVRKLEWLGLDDVLSTKQNDVTSLTCRNQFGDELCGKPFVWESYTIAEIDEGAIGSGRDDPFTKDIDEGAINLPNRPEE